jgi:hypothetical protein
MWSRNHLHNRLQIKHDEYPGLSFPIDPGSCHGLELNSWNLNDQYEVDGMTRGIAEKVCIPPHDVPESRMHQSSSLESWSARLPQRRSKHNLSVRKVVCFMLTWSSATRLQPTTDKDQMYLHVTECKRRVLSRVRPLIVLRSFVHHSLVFYSLVLPLPCPSAALSFLACREQGSADHGRLWPFCSHKNLRQANS